MISSDIKTHSPKWQTGGLLLGAVAFTASGIGAIFNPQQFFISYLAGYLFWIGLPLGCLGLLMIHHLTGGEWGWPLRGVHESAGSTLPLMALLFIPVCFGIKYLYAWSDPPLLAHNQLAMHRSGYMNTSGFILRALIFFALWSPVAHLFRKGMCLPTTSANPELATRLRTLSGPGILFYPLTATFVLVDWVLSLEPDWFSTMFLVLIIVGQILSAIAFSILLLAWLQNSPPLATFVKPVHFHHLGMLLLAFVMLWTYMAFAEFLIIYSGNQPREIAWYLHRTAGSWIGVVWVLFLFHFLLPFFLLLSRELKRNPGSLAIVAVLVLFAHGIYTWWLVVPSFFKTGIHIHWLDITTTAGLGGLWVAAFASNFRNRPTSVSTEFQHLSHES